MAHLTQGLPTGHPEVMEARRKGGGSDRSVCDPTGKVRTIITILHV